MVLKPAVAGVVIHVRKKISTSAHAIGLNASASQ